MNAPAPLPRGTQVVSQETCEWNCKLCPPDTLHNVRGVIDFPDDGLGIAQVKFRTADMPPCWIFPDGGAMWRAVKRLTPVDAVTLLAELV